MFKGKQNKSQPVRESKQDDNSNANFNINKGQSEKDKEFTNKPKLIKKPKEKRSAGAWKDLDSQLLGWSD